MAKRKLPELPDIEELLTGIKRVAEIIADKQLHTLADASVDKFRGMIERQDFQSFRDNPLSKGWAIYKAGHDLDPRVMISTKNYIESIKAIKVKGGYRIGFEEGAPVVDANGKDRGITLDQLAAIHENGVPEKNIPARPHWEPFFEILKNDAASLPGKVVAEMEREVPSRLHVSKK
jgi:hypothetical protein